jgi:hypothetical protein
MKSLVFFFNLPNSSSRIVSLGFTRPVTELGTKNITGDKGRPEHKAQNTPPSGN